MESNLIFSIMNVLLAISILVVQYRRYKMIDGKVGYSWLFVVTWLICLLWIYAQGTLVLFEFDQTATDFHKLDFIQSTQRPISTLTLGLMFANSVVGRKHQ